METYVITGDLARQFRIWLLSTGEYQVAQKFEHLPPSRAEVNVIHIMEVVAHKYLKGNKNDLVSRSRMRHVTLPRHIACYLAHKYTRASLHSIARMMGGLHHTSVKHGVSSIALRIGKDPELAREVAEIEAIIQPSFEQPSKILPGVA